MSTKICVDCSQDKPVTEYYKQTGQLDGLKHSCKSCSDNKTTEWRLLNRAEWNAKNKAYRDRIRAEVLAHYNNECACCQEGHSAFLGVDHIEGGGRQHRKTLKGTSFYKWLIEKLFPAGFQVLCHNCNMAKGFYGVCPHVTEKRALDSLSDTLFIVGGMV